MSHIEASELLVLSAATSEDRQRLRRVIDDITRLEKLAALRVVFVGVLAFLSVPLWIQAAVPHAMPGLTRYFVAAWVPALLAFVAVAVADVVTRRRARRLAECTMETGPALHPATRVPR